MPTWMGVDVGGRRKRFDVALIDDRHLLDLRNRQSVDDVVEWAAAAQPGVVAIDSPRSCASPGGTHRPEERALRRQVGCGIRWTPPHELLDGNPYYEWVVEGLRLYQALKPVGIEPIECFPTASWTIWHGKRKGRSRAAWTRTALVARKLECVPPRTNQDERDAIAAALTARDHVRGLTEAIGGVIVVPLG